MPAAASVAKERITGLVLAGGRGSRMGGVDKGLQRLEGRMLVEHAIERLRPQVGALALNANRHLEVYEALGLPVWPDASPAQFDGPLAGMLAGLRHAGTEWLVTVPCDTPRFPADLVQRLVRAALAGRCKAAMPVTHDADGPQEQRQPVFCLLHRSLREPLEAALAAGERKIDRFTRQQGHVLVQFSEPGDAEAFANANTAEELQRLQRPA